MFDVKGLMWQTDSMDAEELSERLMEFALRVAKMTRALPADVAARNAAGQVIRSSSSTAANYRASQRGKSRKDFINKVKIAVEEADESAFWLEYIERLEIIPAQKLVSLRKEAEEIVKILAAIRRSAGE